MTSVNFIYFPLLTTFSHRKCIRTLTLPSFILVSVLLLCSAAVTRTLSSVIHLPDVNPTQLGSFNFSELEEIVYDVKLLRVPIPERSVSISKAVDSSSESFDGGVRERLTDGYEQHLEAEVMKT